MVKMNCVVVDDEVMGRKLLEENVKQIPFLNLVGSCSNAFEAMEVLQKEQVDLLFLDIQMPGLLGTSFLSSLAVKPLVIFVTAYANYAVESYNLDAVDYLMKPVSLDRFALSANKAYHIFVGKTVVEKEPLEDFFFCECGIFTRTNFDSHGDTCGGFERLCEDLCGGRAFSYFDQTNNEKCRG